MLFTNTRRGLRHESGSSSFSGTKRACPAQPVADASEESAAQRPTKQERSLNDRGAMSDARIGGAGLSKR